MSQLEVDKIIPQSGTTLTIGDSGDTINFADGQNISIDTNTLYIDSTNNRVGIGTTSPATTLHVSGGTANTVSLIESTDAYAWLSVKDNSSANSYINSIGASGDNLQIISKDITFRTASAPNVSTGTYGSERMRIDSSGSVGIGTASPDTLLSLEKNNAPIIQFKDTSGATDEKVWRVNGLNDAYRIQTWNDALSSNQVAYQVLRSGIDVQTHRFYTEDSERMRLTTTGLGIGTSSPAQALDIIDTTNYRQISISNSASTETKRVSYMAKHYDVTEEPVNLIGMFSDSSTTVVSVGGGLGATGDFNSATQIEFHTAANNTTTGNSERMRIDSSGDVFVSKTARDTTDGIELRNDGKTVLRVTGDTPLTLDRKTNEGTMISFRRNDTETSKIATVDNGNIAIGAGTAGILFTPTGNHIRGFDTTAFSSSDNTIDIGRSSTRFKDLYLGGGAFIGGTGTANKLDDYEEGTWTPAVGSGGITITTVTNANYVKVGGQVTATCYISIQGGDSSLLQITGLPVASGTSNYAVNIADFGKGGFKGAYGRVNANSTNIEFFVSSENTSTNRTQIAGNQVGTGYFIFSITYLTT